MDRSFMIRTNLKLSMGKAGDGIQAASRSPHWTIYLVKDDKYKIQLDKTGHFSTAIKYKIRRPRTARRRACGRKRLAWK